MILQMQSTPNVKLNYRDWSEQVQSVTKTNQDNDMTNHINLVYAKIETKLSVFI